MNSGGRLSRVPNQPATPIRGIRVPDEVWRKAQHIARAEGLAGGVSEIVRDCLEAHITAYEMKHGIIEL